MPDGNNTRKTGSPHPGVELNVRRHRAHAHTEPRQEAEPEPTFFVHTRPGRRGTLKAYSTEYFGDGNRLAGTTRERVTMNRQAVRKQHTTSEGEQNRQSEYPGTTSRAFAIVGIAQNFVWYKFYVASEQQNFVV